MNDPRHPSAAHPSAAHPSGAHPSGARPSASPAFSRIVGIVLLALAIALTVVLLTHDHVVRPVTAALDAADRVVGEVDVGIGSVVVLVLVAVARLIPPGRSAGVAHERGEGSRRTARWVEYSLTSSITVFLVSQVNGITEVGTLVLAYAATTAITLFAMVQDRARVRSGHPLLPLCFGAAVGIVPWGVIAFYQIGAGVVGPGLSIIVRVITLVTLAAAFASFVMIWREQRRRADGRDDRAEGRMQVLSSALSGSVFALLVVVGVVVPGA